MVCRNRQVRFNHLRILGHVDWFSKVWPIYPWYKKRQNRKKREEKEAVATE